MSHRPKTLIPGETLGMLGGGQLGRMFALAARPFGYRIAVYGDPEGSPCGQVSDRSYAARYDDFESLAEFANGVSVVSYETENVSLAAVEFLEQRVPVFPNSALLRVSQHRLLEKSALRAIGIPTADFLRITSVAEATAGVEAMGGEGILKTVTMGYDGKGQARVRNVGEAEAAWLSLGVTEAILERVIPFDFELSIVGARFADGSCHFYTPTANTHVNHILDVSICPSPLINAAMAEDARSIARAILEHFGVIGVLCVEFFAVSGGRLLVNEIAPRPHNSGHWTIEACAASQFQQQFRAVAGLAAGDTAARGAAVMVNLLGDHLENLTVDGWRAATAVPGAAVHLYGKSEARKGRKMGHITALGADAAQAEQKARGIRRMLGYDGT
jgi:5-(carboxyamino)imidazole ribonucleotide synthase